MTNIFILCTEIIIEHIFVGFIQNMIMYLSKKQEQKQQLIFLTKQLITEHCTMCRRIAKPAQ